MPPRQKTETIKPGEMAVMAPPKEAPSHELSVGKFVNIVINGQTRHRGAEILTFSGNGLTIRTDVNGLTRSEISLIPWTAIEGIGIIGAR